MCLLLLWLFYLAMTPHPERGIIRLVLCFMFSFLFFFSFAILLFLYFWVVVVVVCTCRCCWYQFLHTDTQWKVTTTTLVVNCQCILQMPGIGQKPSDEFVFGNCFVWDWFLGVVIVDAIFTCTFLTLLEEA